MNFCHQLPCLAECGRAAALAKKSLKAGDKVTRISRIKDISVKQGKTGTLVFVNVAHEIKANSGLAIIEEHDIVYRDKPNSSATPPHPTKKSEIKPDFSEIFQPAWFLKK